MRHGAQNGPLFHFSNHTDDDNDTVEAFNEDENEDILSNARAKASGACVDCKSVKVRCEQVPGERKCRRCQVKNLSCRPRERKKRKPADTHEELQEKAHSQDLRIQELLREYDRLKADSKIRLWITRSHPPAIGDGHRGSASSYGWTQHGTGAEDAARAYFGNGLLERPNLPEIVKHCSLFPEEIVQLFSIFFKCVNPYFSILDEGFHTPQNLIWSSPFLFTVICAVSSRHYTERPTLYPLAMDFARDAAGQGLVEGNRSVDMCQAYLLMAVYPIPKKKWVEDRSWLLMGVAIRMAMELKLNQPPPSDCPERERLNRVRTWLNCYCVDGSHAIQFGKMPMLRLDDYLASSSAEWYRSSSMNTPFDVHLCAYVQIILIMAEWRAATSAQSKNQKTSDSDIISLAIRTQERLSRELGHWVEAYAREFSFMPLPICSYRGYTTQMITAYLKLVVLATGFQAAFRQGLSKECEIFQKSLDAARTVIQLMVERLAPTGYLRYAMDANFLYVSFAAAFLINLLRPKFLPLLDEIQQKEIVVTVTHLISVLGSRKVALDGRHTAALHSRFLSSLLNKYYPKSQIKFFSALGSPVEDVKPVSPIPPPSSDVYYWPDVSQMSTTGPSNLAMNFSGDLICQQHGEPDMDFSLNHFVKTVIEDLPSHVGEMELLECMETWKSWDARNDQAFLWPGHSDLRGPTILSQD